MVGSRRSSRSRSRSSGRKKVVWDERNLTENAEYHRLHPVTMHIDEPKTPYHYMNELPQLAPEEDEMWDPSINAYVKEIKDRITGEKIVASAPVDAKTGLPRLNPKTFSDAHSDEKAKKDFVKIRKAVYADEGAKFRAMLSKKDDDEDED